jgi:phosphocarrier protein FPr/phosphocarrier protein
VTDLVAPLAGWLMPLTEVTDPVFASGSMGEGFAIDPLDGVVVAPCPGVVSAVAPTRHSITLDPAGGGSLLIHIGIDSVALGGEGFELLVEPGAQVTAGAPLMRFDLNAVALGARSLMTPVVAIGEGDRIQVDAPGRRVGCGEPVARLVPGQAAALSGAGETASRTLIVPMPHGIHARPAARIAEAAKLHEAAIQLCLGEQRASARSVVGLLKLAARQGDRIIVEATGSGAAGAVDALAALIESGMGESDNARPAAAPAGAVAAAPGLAIGIAARLGRADLSAPDEGQGMAQEAAALAEALARVAERLKSSPQGGVDIAAAHRGLVEDPELRAAADAEIARGRSAASAWRQAVRSACEALDRTGDSLLRERIPDLLDVERQVIAELLGVDLAAQALPDRAILVADDLLPSEFQALDQDRLAGVALAGGGATSHVAVLAASAGIPMLVALGAAAHAVPEGTTVILDGDAARLDVDPEPAALAQAEARLAAWRDARARARSNAGADARTRDGIRIEVFANLGSTEEAARAVAEGAEGCGLLRTEFLFLDRETAPCEDEQAGIYGRIAAVLGDRPLIVRTFDIGGDKPVPYLPMPAEENPALGCRGVRLNLARPDLLDVQLCAMFRRPSDAS